MLASHLNGVGIYIPFDLNHLLVSQEFSLGLLAHCESVRRKWYGFFRLALML